MGVRILHTFTDVCKEHFYDKRDDFDNGAVIFSMAMRRFDARQKAPTFRGDT